MFAMVIQRTISELIGIAPVALVCRRLHTGMSLGKPWGRSKTAAKIANKQAFFLKKMTLKALEREKTKAPRLTPTANSVGPTVPSSADYFRDFEPRRARVLQHIFLEHITELLATEEFTADLCGYTVNVTSVHYNRRNNHLSVLWDSMGDEAEDQLKNKVLAQIAPKLQHELSNQQLIGTLPRLVFLRDKTSLRMRLLEDTFRRTNMGPTSVEKEEETLPDDALDVTVEASPTRGISVAWTGKTENPLSLDNVPNKRTDAGGLDRQALLERLESSPRHASIKRERA